MLWMYRLIRPSQDFQNAHHFLFLLITLQRECEYTGIIRVCKDVQCNDNEFINHVNTVSLMHCLLFATMCLVKLDILPSNPNWRLQLFKYNFFISENYHACYCIWTLYCFSTLENIVFLVCMRKEERFRFKFCEILLYLLYLHKSVHEHFLYFFLFFRGERQEQLNVKSGKVSNNGLSLCTDNVNAL